MTLDAILGFRLVTADPDRLSRFYAAIGFAIGATTRFDGGVRATVRLGETWVSLDRYDRPGRPYPEDASAAATAFQHFALVTGDAAAAWTRAAQAGATPISDDGPVTLPAGSGGVTAVKFRDPDGHPLEFLQFPDGAAAGWPGRGVIGIDHSAIAVADADRSRVFYRTRGLTEGEVTHNRGDAQAALDGLIDPDALVVPLLPRVARPHLELLAYRRPPVAGPVPGPTDIAATRIVWAARVEGCWQDPDGHRHETVVSR